MMVRTLIACAVLALCSGCDPSVNIKSSLAAYRNAQPGYASLAELPFDKLDLPSEVSFSIDEQSPVYEFGTLGKSYVKAFELPSVSGDYRLVVRSYVVRDGLLKGVMFVPLVTFLDANKSPIGSSTRGNLALLPSTLFDEPTDPQRFQFATMITARSPARYIVIHTSRDLIELGASNPPVQLAAATSVPIFIPMPSGPARMPGSSVGYLKVRIEPTKT
jgi:hypothetical protein